MVNQEMLGSLAAEERRMRVIEPDMVELFAV
jgi:hypothetical protein